MNKLPILTDEYKESDQLKLHPVKINPDYYAVMQNDFVRSDHNVSSLKIAKLLRIMISQVMKDDSDLKTYSVPITELGEFWQIEKTNLYRDVESMCEQLVKTTVKIKVGNGAKAEWDIFPWVNRASYKNGTIIFRFSEEIKPYIIGLHRLYTQYQMKEIQFFKSIYSLRLFELLRCDDGRDQFTGIHTYKIEELRSYFNCTAKYKDNSIFIIRTIEPAVEEINRLTSLELTAEYEKSTKRGRAICAVTFETKWHESKEKKEEWIKFLRERESGATEMTFLDWRNTKI